MDSPPDAEHTHERGVRFSKEIDLAVPLPEMAYPVTTQQWNRLKARIRSIASRESLWVTAGWSLLAVGVSLGAAAGTLTQAENVPLLVLLFFFSATSGGLFGALVCLFGYLDGRGRRKSDIDLAIECMEDIERIYGSEEGRG